MSLFLHKGVAIGLKKSLRQIRTLLVLSLIIGLYCLVDSKLMFYYYLCLALSIITLLLDHQRPQKALAESSFKLADLLLIVSLNSSFGSAVMITGALQSPLMVILLIPVIIFTAEYGAKIGLWNYLGLSLFILYLSISGTTIVTLKKCASPLAFLVVGGACYAAVSAIFQIYNRFHRKTERLLTRDELTGLYNRRFLKDTVSREIKAGRPFGFVLIDINYFKYFNDYWGHSAGDNLLITIGRLLNKNVRPQDFVIRHSGDEFILLLPESDPSTVETVLDRIIQAVESTNFPGEECFPNRKLSLAYGFAFFPGEASNYQDLFAAADKALYRYKREGLVN